MLKKIILASVLASSVSVPQAHALSEASILLLYGLGGSIVHINATTISERTGVPQFLIHTLPTILLLGAHWWKSRPDVKVSLNQNKKPAPQEDTHETEPSTQTTE